MIHIGQLIKEEFERNKHLDINGFASRLSCKRANIYNIFGRPTIDTALLYKISQALDHDFFYDISCRLKEDAGEELDAKQDIYERIMRTMGQQLTRQLKRVDITGRPSGRYQLNTYNNEASPLPPSRFKVYVQAGEDEDVTPHIHVASIDEVFEVRFTISDDSSEPKLLPVKNFGTRKLDDKFEDIQERTRKWLYDFDGHKSHRTIPGIKNCIYAGIVYRTLNPTPEASAFEI